MSKEKEAPTVSAPSLQMTRIKITNKDEVTIEAIEKLYVSAKDGEESRQRTNKHSVTSDYPPHPDFLKEMLGLRRFAMSMVEFSRKDLPLVNSMTVGELKISGEQELENSRVQFVLMKWIKRSGKGVPINTGEAVMYGKDGKEIPDTIEMTKQIDKVIGEAWEYLNGKNGVSKAIQLAFTFKKKVAVV